MAPKGIRAEFFGSPTARQHLALVSGNIPGRRTNQRRPKLAAIARALTPGNPRWRRVSTYRRRNRQQRIFDGQNLQAQKEPTWRRPGWGNVNGRLPEVHADTAALPF